MHSGQKSVPAHAETLHCDAIPILVISGEIDSQTVDIVFDEVDKCLVTRPQAMVLELDAVTFLGSAGLRLLLHAHLGMEKVDARLAVVAAHSTVLKPLRITDLDQTLVLYPSRSDALVAVGASPTGSR
ncbi:STAS domain-containing protein [Lentzea sp. NPDC102401]|uniref:STAS domain-containing protein n=1 Tax=Lentzea sp. NPDC102401 TaxID=3364128 RepID=UPI003815C252